MPRHKLWAKEPWMLTLPRGSASPNGSVYQAYDIVIQSCVLSRISDSRILHSAGPFTVRYKTAKGKVVERSAKLS